MQVSVITPVYNAAEFVTRAVESALAQPETGEVLLIEDGSSDGSLAVCQKLAEKYDKVKLLCHPDGENRGAGASRNLGLRHASCEFLGFLDADDFYLENRFQATKLVFLLNPDCDGVYGSIDNSIEDDDGLLQWQLSKRQPYFLKGMKKVIAPEDLGKAIISGHYGGIHLDALVIKRSVIRISGLMSEQLHLHQDTEFIIRVALVAKLLPEHLDVPIASRGINSRNRISAMRSKMSEYKNRMVFWMCLYHWAKLNADNDVQRLIIHSVIEYNKSHKYFKKFPLSFFPVRLVWIVRLFRLICYPEVMISAIKQQNPIRNLFRSG